MILALIAVSVYWGVYRHDLEPANAPERLSTGVPRVTTSEAEVPRSTTAPQHSEESTPAAPSSSWKSARATVFWVGEGEGAENGFIHNRSSAWDVDWEKHFGGYDDPECRNGFYPCAFTPKENPFYVALPYNDLFLDGQHKDDPRLPPGPRIRYESDLKNRWIAVKAGEYICYAQWQDVGPFGEDDIEYVFGTAQTPLNRQGERAGIDLSPAMRDCLKVGGLSDVEWRHVDTNEVLDGPWKLLMMH